MPKGYSVYADIVGRQNKKKVYRNSECSKCGTWEKELKYKDGFGIICRECFRELYILSKPKA
jgi:ribosomal protein S14